MGPQDNTRLNALREAVRRYAGRGWRPLRLREGSKIPEHTGWAENPPTLEEVLAQLNGRHNLGVVLGRHSGNLVDVDLDHPLARKLAPKFLPPTGAIFGRKSARGSHWLYICDPLPRSAVFPAPGGAMLVEVRAEGHQTMFPPSVHPDGEEVEWEKDGEPARVSGEELLRAVRRLAAAVLLALYWPEKGSREYAALALAGGLARLGWEAEEVAHFVEAVAEAAGDEEAEKRRQAALDTVAKYQAGDEEITGWHRLGELLGDEVVRQVRGWLETGERPKAAARRTEAERPAKRSLADDLVAFALNRPDLMLFQGPRSVVYARISVDGHYETWPLESGVFRDWLMDEYYDQVGKAPYAEAVSTALSLLAARARRSRRYQDPIPVYLRVAPDGAGGVYIDLGDGAWRAIHVTADGWEIVDWPPVHFYRPPGQLSLPIPVRGGSLEELRGFINLPDDGEAWALIKAWLTAALYPRGPYPVLVLRGEQGSAKSTTTKILRRLIDPMDPDLRAEPKELRDLMIMAEHNWVLALDNLSGLPPWLSDALARLATGAGWGVRKLWSDLSEVLFRAARPIVLNGIPELVTRADLLDRAIEIRLPPISEERRRTEEELWAEFDRAAPQIFGALLDRLSGTLRARPSVSLPRKPRMADFACLAVAAERGAGEEARFLQAYTGMREEADLLALEASPFGAALLEWLEKTSLPWEGTAKELQAAVEAAASENEDKDKDKPPPRRPGWPKTPRGVRSELDRLAPALRRLGYSIRYERRGHSRQRLIAIDFSEKPPAGPSAPSAPSASLGAAPFMPTSANESALKAPAEDRDAAPDADGLADGADGIALKAEGDRPRPRAGPVSLLPTDAHQSSLKALPTAGADGADDADGRAPAFSEKSTGALKPPAPVDFRLITSAEELKALLPELLATPVLGFDLETTGLDPLKDRLRLIQLAVPGEPVYVIDCFAVPQAALAEALEPLITSPKGPLLVGHNLKFDLRWLFSLGLAVPQGRLFDTMLAAQVLDAGLPGALTPSLEDLAKRFLGEELPKELQKADWAGPLTPAMLEYAARDAEVALRLMRPLKAALEDPETRLWSVAVLEFYALPAIAWLEHNGVPFDKDRWLALAAEAKRAREEAEAKLRATAAAQGLGLLAEGIDWESPKQTLEALKALGIEVPNTADETLHPHRAHPVVAALLEFREAAKRENTYGERFAARVVGPDGRIRPDWRQIGAETGRMACRNPNLQNIPRDPAYRACFRAPAGRVFIKADYNQIELRIAAEISKDPRMLEAYQKGEDLHTLTARLVLGRTDVTKEDRQAAKAVNFGLLYGMSAEGFQKEAGRSYGLSLTLEEAARWRARFFEVYAGLRRWHRSQPPGEVEIRTLSGRRRLKVSKFTEKLNTPVQGTGADGLKAGLALLYKTRDRFPSARLILAVHDEVVVECDEAEAEAVRDWVKDCLERGMKAFVKKVPIKVEPAICRDWSGAPVPERAGAY